MLNLILWRHAQARDGVPDLERELTPKGVRQAQRMARWLLERLPEHYEVRASPAVRTRQTADALGVAYRTDARLGPGAGVADYLAAIDWPEGPASSQGTVVVVGHQPVLGGVASLLLSGREEDWSVAKGAIWWFGVRERDGDLDVVLRASIVPDLL
jgi:phosphohistidine phosphatase